jgi:hypothetical protein
MTEIRYIRHPLSGIRDEMPDFGIEVSGGQDAVDAAMERGARLSRPRRTDAPARDTARVLPFRPVDQTENADAPER